MSSIIYPQLLPPSPQAFSSKFQQEKCVAMVRGHLHPTAGFLLVEHSKERKKKCKILPKGFCSQCCFWKPCNCKATGCSCCSAACFALLLHQEKVSGSLKKITCCIHVVGQVANNLLWFGSHHKISFYTVCRAPKFATTLLMATNKCTAV